MITKQYEGPVIRVGPDCLRWASVTDLSVTTLEVDGEYDDCLTCANGCAKGCVAKGVRGDTTCDACKTNFAASIRSGGYADEDDYCRRALHLYGYCGTYSCWSQTAGAPYGCFPCCHESSSSSTTPPPPTTCDDLEGVWLYWSNACLDTAFKASHTQCASSSLKAMEYAAYYCPPEHWETSYCTTCPPSTDFGNATGVANCEMNFNTKYGVVIGQPYCHKIGQEACHSPLTNVWYDWNLTRGTNCGSCCEEMSCSPDCVKVYVGSGSTEYDCYHDPVYGIGDPDTTCKAMGFVGLCGTTNPGTFPNYSCWSTYLGSNAWVGALCCETNSSSSSSSTTPLECPNGGTQGAKHVIGLYMDQGSCEVGRGWDLPQIAAGCPAECEAMSLPFTVVIDTGCFQAFLGDWMSWAYCCCGGSSSSSFSGLRQFYLRCGDSSSSCADASPESEPFCSGGRFMCESKTTGAAFSTKCDAYTYMGSMGWMNYPGPCQSAYGLETASAWWATMVGGEWAANYKCCCLPSSSSSSSSESSSSLSSDSSSSSSEGLSCMFYVGCNYACDNQGTFQLTSTVPWSTNPEIGCSPDSCDFTPGAQGWSTCLTLGPFTADPGQTCDDYLLARLAQFGTPCALTVGSMPGCPCDTPALLGACCRNPSFCISETESSCLANGGIWKGVGVVCGVDTCAYATDPNCQNISGCVSFMSTYSGTCLEALAGAFGVLTCPDFCAFIGQTACSEPSIVCYPYPEAGPDVKHIGCCCHP